MPSNKHRSTKGKKEEIKSWGVFNDEPLSFYQRLLFIAVVVLLLGGFFILKDLRRYSVNADDVSGRIQAALDAVQPLGKQLASSKKDMGCDSRSSVGLRSNIECSIDGYSYFEISGDKKSALRLADSKLQALGFKKDGSVNDYDNRVLDGLEEGDVNYTNHYTSVQLGWSTLPGGANGPGSTAVAEGLSLHRIGSLGDGVTVVGATAHETYWSCSSGGLDLFGLGCAFPPHSPNKQL